MTRRRSTRAARIAERCTFDLTPDLDYRFPDYRHARRRDRRRVSARRSAASAARERYGLIDGSIPRASRSACERSCGSSRKHGLAGFFLVYREVLELSREVAAEVRGEHARAPMRTCRRAAAVAPRSARSSAT